MINGFLYARKKSDRRCQAINHTPDLKGMRCMLVGSQKAIFKWMDSEMKDKDYPFYLCDRHFQEHKRFEQKQ